MKKMQKLLFMVVFATAATVFVGCGRKGTSGRDEVTARNRRHERERIKRISCLREIFGENQKGCASGWRYNHG